MTTRSCYQANPKASELADLRQRRIRRLFHSAVQAGRSHSGRCFAIGLSSVSIGLALNAWWIFFTRLETWDVVNRIPFNLLILATATFFFQQYSSSQNRIDGWLRRSVDSEERHAALVVSLACRDLSSVRYALRELATSKKGSSRTTDAHDGNIHGHESDRGEFAKELLRKIGGPPT